MVTGSVSRRGVLGTAVAAGTVTALAGTAHAGESQAAAAQRSANGRLYELARGNQRVVIAGVAATLLSWQVDGEELLLTHSAEEVGEGYQGKTIVPWCNRIDHGRYTFHGQQYAVPINEPERDTALHGLLSFHEWQLVSQREDRVVLETQQYPHYGYPFHVAFRIEYSLGRGGFSCTLTARNLGTVSAPFGTANHTYIRAAAGTIDAMRLELPAATYYRVNDRLIPTGTAPVAGTDYDFRQQRQLGSTTMDTAFTDVRREADGLAIVRIARDGEPDVELWMDSSYGYLQVYTDDDPEGHAPRSGIAVEPVSCAPDCFNSGDGLVVLRPKQGWQGTWGWRLS